MIMYYTNSALLILLACWSMLSVDAFSPAKFATSSLRLADGMALVPRTSSPEMNHLSLEASATKDSEESPTQQSSANRSDDGSKNLSLANEKGNPLKQFAYRFLAAGGGEIGKRGEVYFFAQAVPIVGIALGGLPFASDALRVLAGPALLLLGLAVMALTAMDMGDSLTPWPKPNGEGLVKTGLYSQVRHPMYAGLLAFLSGFAVWTASIDRLLLVALLWVILDIKSDFEESELIDAYPVYPEYQKQVQSKFFPQVFLNIGKRTKTEP